MAKESKSRCRPFRSTENERGEGDEGVKREGELETTVE
jgi:hypothetical protein